MLSEVMNMAEEKNKLSIRSALIPVFYQDFHCLAQDCRDSCCVNWRVAFDKKDYLRLRRLDASPALRERLEQGVRRIKRENRSDRLYGEFDLESSNGRCPFLGGDGLCAIQCDCGHSALPEVCAVYPRRAAYTPAAREYSLSPSCEGVLQLLWDLPEGVEFVEDPLAKADWRTVPIPQTENLLPYFAPVRGVCIDILQNRAMSLTQRMLCLGVVIQRLQKEDWANFNLDGWAGQAMLLAEPGAISELDIPGNQNMYLMQNLNVLDVIAASKKDWPRDIYSALKVERSLVSSDGGDRLTETVNLSKGAYADALAQFKDSFSHREYFFENLMVAAALYLSFPTLSSKEKLWKRYVSLCNLYSFYRFVSVLGCKDDTSRERLFHMIVMASRAILHNQDRFNGFQEELFKHDSSTLAHMAILLRWD